VDLQPRQAHVIANIAIGPALVRVREHPSVYYIVSYSSYYIGATLDRLGPR
jgi:hypothetical protein